MSPELCIQPAEPLRPLHDRNTKHHQVRPLVTIKHPYAARRLWLRLGLLRRLRCLRLRACAEARPLTALLSRAATCPPVLLECWKTTEFKHEAQAQLRPSGRGLVELWERGLLIHRVAHEGAPPWLGREGDESLGVSGVDRPGFDLRF